MATLADIADRVGVSVMTASRALNDQPGVAQKTRERILKTARALGYVPNPSARSLVEGRTRMLGMIVPDLSSQYMVQVLAGAGQAARQAGLDMLLHTNSHNVQRELEGTALLGKGLVDGLLAVIPLDPGEVLEALSRAGTPVVLIDAIGTHSELPIIAADNYQGARLAMQHFTQLGHRRIAFIKGTEDMEAAQERFRAYRDGLATAGLTFDSELVQPGDFTQPSAFQAASELLNLAQPPTAIFAANDMAAFGAIEAVKERGLRVPGDVSVIGFDDIPMASQIYPALTTVRQPLEEMGQAAVNMLTALISGIAPVARRITLPTQLIVRESTARPRARGKAARPNKEEDGRTKARPSSRVKSSKRGG